MTRAIGACCATSRPGRKGSDGGQCNSSRLVSPEAVLEHVEPGADIVMPNANGEAVKLLDTLEEHAEELRGVRIHQMQALRERRYINGEFGDHLRHVSMFLSPATRKAYLAGTCDLLPNHFSEVPDLLRRYTKCSLVIAAASPPNRHRVLLAGHQLRLHRIPDRHGAVLPRVRRTDAADLQQERGAHQPGGGMDRG